MQIIQIQDKYIEDIVLLHFADELLKQISNNKTLLEKWKNFYRDKIIFYKKEEPQGFILIKEQSKIVGFIIAVKDIKKLKKYMFLKGYAISWFYKTITGQYPIKFDFLNKIKNFIVSLFKTKSDITLTLSKIIAIIVDKNFRGKGYSKILLSKAEEYLKQNNIKKVFITTSIDNEIAQNVYLKNGFIIKGECIESTGKSIILEKEIK